MEQRHNKFRKPDFKLSTDIYSLAFAALINTEMYDYSHLEGDKDQLKKFLPKEQFLTRRERSATY